MALAVEEDVRRREIGTALLYKTEEWPVVRRIAHICVNSGLRRMEAHEFYQKNRYVKKSFAFNKEIRK